MCFRAVRVRFPGFTAKERQQLYAWPDSMRLFGHFRVLPGPPRVGDLAGSVRALGIEPPPAFSRTFQGTPMRRRDAEVGSFFLTDKADGEAFTGEDEEAANVITVTPAYTSQTCREGEAWFETWRHVLRHDPKGPGKVIDALRYLLRMGKGSADIARELG